MYWPLHLVLAGHARHHFSGYSREWWPKNVYKRVNAYTAHPDCPKDWPGAGLLLGQHLRRWSHFNSAQNKHCVSSSVKDSTNLRIGLHPAGMTHLGAAGFFVSFCWYHTDFGAVPTWPPTQPYTWSKASLVQPSKHDTFTQMLFQHWNNIGWMTRDC